MRPYIQLTKPRITWLILMSTAIGFVFGSQAGWSGWTLAWTLLGTGLLASGTATLNQWWERDADGKMHRTQDRPLPSGQISPGRAFSWGVLLSIAGFALLAQGVNLLSALLGLFTLLSYLVIYTPLKRISPHSTTVGAIPGAMPPLIGYAAAAGVLTAEAWVLYAILFVWQFPHFYSIAWMYRDDYSRAGIRMLPVVQPDGQSTARHIMLTSLLLIPVSLAPVWFSMTGTIYFVGAAVAGLYFLYTGVRVVMDRSLLRARAVLLSSVIYLPVLYGLMLLDRPGL
jgi:protoheme IX farnesyltransferase